jgi:hypothetical protein
MSGDSRTGFDKVKEASIRAEMSKYAYGVMTAFLIDSDLPLITSDR